MKETLKRLLVVLAIALCQSSVIDAQAVIKFEQPTHDFGTFQEKEKVSYSFVFTNTGDEPLVIQQVFSSCGCTVANFTKEPIAPNAQGKLHVTYNGKGKFPGHFKKAITVRSNASNGMVRVYIEGIMQADGKK